jgi:hypothetical protein
MRSGIILANLLLLAGLSGCVGNDSGDAPGFTVGWSDLEVRTTPLESFEQAGTNLVRFGEDVTFIYVEREDGMHRYAILDGHRLLVSNFLQGFTEYALEDYPSFRTYRYQLWDANGVLDQSNVIREVDENTTVVHSSMSTPQGNDEVTLTFDFDGPNLRSLRMDTGLDPESPYTFTPATQPFPKGFGVEMPTNVLSPQEVDEKDELARAGHVEIIQWIDAYVSQTGSTPENVDESTLRLQMGLSGQWPTNPYNDQDMARSEQSGDFRWLRCSGSDATYLGYGWDGSPIGTSYGRGCTD